MKSIFLFALLACSTLFVNAKSIDTANPTEELQKQISEIVTSSDIWESADKSFKLVVTFMVNSNGEIVILETNNKDWDDAIKSVLNYKKLKVSTALKNQIFHLPISLEKSK